MMKKLTIIFLILLTPIFGFTQEKNQMSAEEISRNYLVLAPHGIYNGYGLYKYRGIGFHNRFPSKYSYYINQDAFSEYLKIQEPDFKKNIKKYRSASNSGREIYNKHFSKELTQLSEKNKKEGLVSFREVVLELYKKATTIEKNYNPITLKFYNKETMLSDNYSFNSEDWKLYLKKYDIINAINDARNITDVDEIVNKTDYINKRLKYLNYIIRLSDNLEKDLVSLSEYDRQVKENQNNFPGRFRNEYKLKTSRDNHIEKLENKAYLNKATSKETLKDIKVKISKAYLIKEVLDDNICENTYTKNNYNEYTEKWYLKAPSMIDIYILDDTGVRGRERYVKKGSLPINPLQFKENKPMGSGNTDLSKETDYIFISVDNLRVRETASMEGKTIEYLPLNTKVEFLNKKSFSETTVKIKEKEITDFWYKIKTPNTKIGWIHGCCFSK